VDPDPSGVAEVLSDERRATSARATIVRGLLGFAPAGGTGRTAPGELLDVSGRKVLDLHPGANDVRALAPGVYFVHEAQTQAQAIRKVVVTR
jgi:hypothetical protein